MDTALLVLTGTAILFAFLVAVFAIRFMHHYWDVEWRGNPWGEHVMIFSGIVALTYGITALSQLLGLLIVLGVIPALDSRGVALGGLIVTNILFGAAAYEMWNRGRLERKAQRTRVSTPTRRTP